MEQIPLRILPRLPYTAESFLLHEGVRDLYHRCLAGLQSGAFSICCIYGHARSGKTHLSVRLACDLLAAGKLTTAVEPLQFPALIDQRIGGEGVAAGEVVILDDAQQYFETLRDSGEFVSLVEALRTARGGLALLTTRPIDELPVDEHIISRLRPGEGFTIGHPAEADLPGLLTAMAKQRGVLLSPRKVDYLARRAGREIAALEESLRGVL